MNRILLDAKTLKNAMAGQDVVYANLAGDLPRMARTIVAAMQDSGIRRLIFIISMGIYDEVPGQKYRSVLDPYRDSAAVVEASDLEPFRGGVVSRKSVASLIVKLATTAGLEARHSLGVSKREPRNAAANQQEMKTL